MNVTGIHGHIQNLWPPKALLSVEELGPAIAPKGWILGKISSLKEW